MLLLKLLIKYYRFIQFRFLGNKSGNGNIKNEDPFKLMEIKAIKTALQKTKGRKISIDFFFGQYTYLYIVKFKYYFYFLQIL
jgi:hypothetical protein